METNNKTPETPSEKKGIFEIFGKNSAILASMEKIKNTFENFLNKILEKIGFNLDSLRKEVEKGAENIKNNFTEKASQISDEISWENTETTNIQTSKKNTKNSAKKTASANSEYATKKPLGGNVKLMKNLTPEESNGLARKIFGDGPGTELLIKIDGGTGMAIKRMIALGYHEGKLKFGRANPDPRSGFNIGTFQIGGSKTSRKDSEKKYENCFNAGVKLAEKNGITKIPPFSIIEAGQRDLIAHLGYIESQRGGESTFDKLRDPNLPEKQVVTLMHRKIQWGISAIGHSVVQQINTNKIDTSELA